MASNSMKSGHHINLVIKLGGSAVTDKESLETVRPEELAEAARLISECWKQQLTCVVVHGAGSFGHHQAKEYSVNKGWNGLNSERQADMRRGFCLTRQSVLKACGTWSTDDGKLTLHNVLCVEALLCGGFIPVLHGDCVLDSHRGCAILSGDVIIKTLCRQCRVDRVLFLTNVDGVYNMPPDEPDARLLDRIYVYKDGAISSIVSTSNSRHDITGGMKLKLHTATDIVKHSGGRTQVFVCKIGAESAREACLEGFSDGFKNGTAILIQSSLPSETE